MDKNDILVKLDKAKFYRELIPSLKVNGKPEALGLCPFHADTNPSLSVNLQTGLFRCFSCDAKGDVFAFYQKHKGVDFLTALKEIGKLAGAVESDTEPKIVAAFKYHDSDGRVLYSKERVEPGRNGRSKEFVFKHLVNGKLVLGRGCDPVLYNLPGLITSKYCFVVEGEAKADLLNSWGLTATCLDSGANSPWKDEYSKAFENVEKVIILPDNDNPGRAYASKIAHALHDKVRELKVVELPGLGAAEDVIDWAKTPGNAKDKLLEIVEGAMVWTPGCPEVMEVVNDNSGEKIEIVDFPIDVFPVGLKKMVLDVSNSMGVPVSVTGSIALTILGAAIGNAIKISPKMSFEVSPFLWTCVVMPTGSGKSPLLELLTKPVKGKQAAAYKRYTNELKQYQLSFRAFKKNDSDKLPDEPILEQYMINDSTVEALSAAFEGQPRGLLSIQDELASWLLSMNQYKSSGNDRQSYLQLFNSGSWSINRKSGVKFLPSTGLGIVGNIQPETIPLVFGKASLDDGLIQRLLFVYPDMQPMKFNRNTINNLYLWEDILAWCYQLPMTTDDNGFVIPRTLRIEGTALDTYEHFYNEYGAIATILPARYRGFISKLFIYCLKFAGILHVVQGYGSDLGGNIAESVVTDAIKLTKFYFGQISLILKLYERKKTIGESQNRLIHVLCDLRGDVDKGMLRLETIVDRFNDGLPGNYQLTPERIANILRNVLGLTTQRTTNNYSCLVWDDEKLKKLFKATLTTSTTSITLTEKLKKPEVREVREVDFEEIFEVEELEVLA